MRKFVVSAAALCLAATPAIAEDFTLYVKYSDLNLTSAEGIETLEARIATAVKTACAKPDMILDLKSMDAWESCKADTTAKARAQLARTVELAAL
jgi:UrcA family protein